MLSNKQLLSHNSLFYFFFPSDICTGLKMISTRSSQSTHVKIPKDCAWAYMHSLRNRCKHAYYVCTAMKEVTCTAKYLTLPTSYKLMYKGPSISLDKHLTLSSILLQACIIVIFCCCTHFLENVYSHNSQGKIVHVFPAKPSPFIVPCGLFAHAHK